MNTPFPHTEIKSKKRYDEFTCSRLTYWGLWVCIYVLQQIMEVGTETIPVNATAAWFYASALGFAITVVLALLLIAARCRDAGLNGWWCLAGIIPFAMIYFGCMRPDDHPKKLRAFEKLRVHKGDCV